MSAGIRAELSLDAKTSCPVARIADDAETATQSISKTTAPDTATVTEEFVLDGPADVDAEPDVEEVFSYGSERVYRFERSVDRPCPCESVEEYGSPVLDVAAESGSLEMAFHADDMDHLQQVVTSLRRQYDEVNVNRLLRSRNGDTEAADLVLVDRSELTARQEEVLNTAHQLGYFDHPKGANAGDVAESLGITTSTFTEHLAAAQSKLLSAILQP
ncbi:helix-turn-helix domain-containing protein [Halanaeroarchaeum sp. HSR-CO]|uniref:helix-turn-helix domain-containing protein n=1 Tax=Halanaeroarchaeum sp. HSR-CO TaxID=2866382 RepID=UPI00217D63E5|nr:helix-turn-helix domain-containing protein [Halanaeroarchaeum sp. HSR-CO]